MSEIMITLNAIQPHRLGREGWEKLLAHLGKTQADDEPFPLSALLDSNGFEDALWCLHALPEEFGGRIRLLACAFAERALRFVPAGEERPRVAIETARRFVRGEATREELAAARATALFCIDLAADAASAAAADAASAADAALFAVEAAECADAPWNAEITAQAAIFRAWCASGGEITDPSTISEKDAA